MKKIVKLFMIMFICFGIISCTDTTNNNSITIKIEDNVLLWDSYTNALNYNIYIDNILTDTVTTTRYDLSLKEGTYQIKVNAKTTNGYSSFSNILEYYSDGVKYNDIIVKLQAPVIKLTDGILYWNNVLNAVSYDIYKNDSLLDSITSLSYNIDEVYGDKYYVVARSGNSYSDKSNVIEINGDINTGVVNIFSINDTHGAASTNANVAGLDKVETLINSLETDTDYIKVANGDIFQGGYASNVTRGRIFIDILNEMEFDCFVIGNHEFDWGIETISVYKDGDLSNGEANFPFLGANIVYKSSSTMPEWLDEYTIVENNGLRVGIIGVIGEGLTSSILAENVENYEFLNPVPIVERIATTLRTDEDCDVVVVATHDYDSDTNAQYATLFGDARIDAILCAHTHQKINETVNRTDNYKIPVLQSNTKNITVGTINLTLENGDITKKSVNHYYPSNYSSSTNILDIIKNYEDVILEGEKVVGYTSSYLSKSYLGPLAANGMVELTGSDFACLNTGGVRSTIDTGTITMEDIYEVFPFDNKLIIVEMSGSTLKSFYNTADGYLYFSSNININNISNNKTYKICVIDYVYNYYYYQKFFRNQKATTLDLQIRDAVVYKIENGI